MSKITLIGIDTAKNVFHLVGIDKRGNYTAISRLVTLVSRPRVTSLDFMACSRRIVNIGLR